MIAWIVNILKAAGPAAMGYFVNDVARWFNNLLPQSVKDKTENGQAKWFLIVVLCLMVGALFIVLKFVIPRGKKARGFMVFVLGLLFIASQHDGNPAAIGLGLTFVFFGTALVTLTTGAAVVTSVNLQFLPEKIWYAAATQLSGVKISVQGDGVVFDSDTNGLTHIGLNRIIGQVTNNYAFTLGDSLIPKKNVLFEFTNSAAQTPIVYYDSDSMPAQGEEPWFLQTAKVPLLVGGQDFSDFATLSLPSLAATDSVTVTYRNGTVQANMTRVDLNVKMGFTQNVVNTPIYQIDNYNRNISKVTIIVGTAQTAYMQRWTPSLKGSGIPGQA